MHYIITIIIIINIIKRLNEITAAWVSRVNLMEGEEGLEKLNHAELKKLSTILKVYCKFLLN